MADQKVSISGPVQIQSSSREDVAFKLMQQISSDEADVKKDRKYWLTLYWHCLKATEGIPLRTILQTD